MATATKSQERSASAHKEGSEDRWERVQWSMYKLLVESEDPLLREIVYRKSEQCIEDCDVAPSDGLRERRLRQLRVTYLMAADCAGLPC